MNRFSGHTYKIKAPRANRGSVFLHVYKDKDNKLAHMSISHQITDDFPSEQRHTMAEVLDQLSELISGAVEGTL